MDAAMTRLGVSTGLALVLALAGCGDDDRSATAATATPVMAIATAVATATPTAPPATSTPMPSATPVPVVTATSVPTSTASPTPEEPRCPAPQLPPGVEIGDAEIRFTEDCRAFVRTADERFAGLAGYDFEPHYATVDGMRMHYVDEGPADGEVVLMLHGQPAWAYLYRKMIPPLAAAGFRAIAVDHIGMGRSDKPVQFDDYRYLQHVRWVEEFLDALDLHDVTLFCHDWGSLIGLRVVGDEPERFARVVVANGRLPVVPATVDLRSLFTIPDPPTLDPTAPFTLGRCDGTYFECFSQWITYALTNPAFRPSQVLPVATATTLSVAELAAYDAPFPDLIYMSGVRTFPSLVVTLNDLPTNEAARAVLDQFDKPLLTVFGRLDPNLGSDAVQAELRDTVPGAQGQPHHAYPDAKHFVQEDKGEDLAARVIDFMRANSLPTDPIERRIDEIFPGEGRFGTLNRVEARRLLTADPDGPFYMLNLIRHRARADYLDGRPTTLTGREADALYGAAVLPILSEIGAEPVFIADVESTLLGAGEWDQVAVARYPSRAAFLGMLQRPDFRAAAIHKEAGVETTLVIVTERIELALPPEAVFDPAAAPFPPTEEDPSFAMVHLLAFRDMAQYADGREATLTGREAMDLYTDIAGAAAGPLGIRPGGWLDVEGVLVGDGRVWDEARINLFPSHATLRQLLADPTWASAQVHRAAALRDSYSLMTLPMIDRLRPQ